MNKKGLIIFLCFFLSLNLLAQNKERGYSALSSPEKWWVISHPFKAKKAFKISLRALEVADSIRQKNTIGKDNNGGKLDAFKHAFWMASLSHHIGSKSAIKLGKAHEKGNYKSFLNGNPEDGILPDKISSDMDLFNNQAGSLIASNYSEASEIHLIKRTIELLNKGGLRIIKKDKNIFLTCLGQPIQEESLIGTWENDKCLIPSNDP